MHPPAINAGAGALSAVTQTGANYVDTMKNRFASASQISKSLNDFGKNLGDYGDKQLEKTYQKEGFLLEADLAERKKNLIEEQINQTREAIKQNKIINATEAYKGLVASLSNVAIDGLTGENKEIAAQARQVLQTAIKEAMGQNTAQSTQQTATTAQESAPQNTSAQSTQQTATTAQESAPQNTNTQTNPSANTQNSINQAEMDKISQEILAKVLPSDYKLPSATNTPATYAPYASNTLNLNLSPQQTDYTQKPPTIKSPMPNG